MTFSKHKLKFTLGIQRIKLVCFVFFAAQIRFCCESG